MQINLIMTSTTTNNTKLTTTISYVRETATNAQLKALAQALNALTTNTYSSVTRDAKEVIT